MEGKMLKKFLAVLVALFVFATLWAQNPTKDFPYYYYETPGGTNNCYDLLMKNEPENGKEIENNDEWTVLLIRSRTIHYLLHIYKPGQAESRSELRRVLAKHKSVYKELDEKIDKHKRNNYHVCLLFFDASHNLISSALYSEDY